MKQASKFMTSLAASGVRLAALILAALVAGGAWAVAPTPTVVWESDFSTVTKTGTDGNTYTLNLNSNSNGSGEAITISQSLGATIDFSSAFAAADGGSVLIRYSNLPLDTTQRAIVTTKCGSNNDRTGVWINTDATAGKTGGVWGGANHNSAGNTRTTLDSNKSAGVMAFTYHHTGGSYLYYLANGVRTIQHGDSGLKGNGDTISGIAIGGTRATSTTGTAATGMKITGIAIFKGVLTDSQMTSFVWPSAVAAEYNKWNYAAAGRVVTWKSLPDASLDSGTGQKITVAGTTYGVFDTHSGSDIGTYYGGSTANSGAYWNYFCIGKTVYSPPGSVMRFVASDTYAHNVRADFSPLTIGGIIVESGATGYTIAEDASNARKDNRAVILGDQPASGQETWFRFNEDFTFGRQGALVFVGSVNINVAAGKTVTVTEKANSSSETFVPKVCSSVTANSDNSGALSTLTGGGALRLHGAGKFVSTAGLDASGATLDYTDLSATSSTAAGAYIQGTLTVNDSTVIALPDGATFPYFVATGISGALDSETGVTIGGVAAPNYVAKADGSIIYSAPAEVTISSDATWGSGDLDGWTTDDATKNYIINVTGDATLTLGSAVSLNKLTLNVSEGVTLTISGGCTITAADCIYVTGGGEVATSTAPTFSGTVKGDGTLYYNGVRPTTTGSDVVLTDSDWSGTVRITYNKENTATSTARQLFPQHWGSVNSKIKWNGVCGYFGGTTSKAGWVLEDLTVESSTYPALLKNDGGSSATDTVPSLSGSGTFADESNPTEIFKFADASEFNGAINITSSANNGMHVQFGATAVTKQARTITVLSGASVAVPAGKTWAAPGGIVVNGTLTVPSTATLTGAISGSGTVVGTQCFPVPGSSFTGTLTINAASAPSYTGSSATAIYGSVLNIASGMAYLSGNVTHLPDAINIANNSYLVVGNADMASLTLNIDSIVGTGMLYINDQCTSLAALTINAGTNRGFANNNFAITSSTTLSTVNIVLDEVAGEGGTITLTNVSGLTAIEGRTYNFTVNRVDGTPVTGTYDSAASTVSYTPAISGAATDIDWDFTDGEDDDLEQKPSGVDKNADSTMTFYTDATDSTKTGVYIKHHPYITGAASFMGNNSAAMTVAVVGTMPATSNTIFLNVGSAYAQQYGLVFLTTTNANEVLIGYNYGGTVTPITTMTVPNSSTARHSYIVTKVDGSSTTTFTVYLDGIKWKTVTTASKIAFASSNSGVQVGSDFGGNIRNNGYSAASDNVGVLNVLRVYGRIITDAEIAVYASTFPYVSPNGASSRTFATAAEDWVEATDTDWTNTDSSGTTTQGTAPSAGASVTVTAAEATEITVNLASDTQYEALTINGSAVALKKGTNAGKLSVTGMTVVGAPVTVEYGAADFSGGPMTITEDGTITFDYSGYDISAIYTTTDIPLTSDVAEDAAKVFLTAPSASYRTVSLVYMSGQYIMRVTPVHEAGTELYYKSGYFGKNAAAGEEFTVVLSDGTTTAPVFPGDIVVIDSKSSQDPIYVGELPDNVAAIRIDRATRLSSGNASIAMLDGAVVTVADGVQATIQYNYNNINLGSVVFNKVGDSGTGSVAFDNNGGTLSVSGAVSGTATLTVNGTVNVASGGSIANTLAGSGTLAFAAVPSSALTFGDWTGTVQLPAITSDAIIFNNYGTTGSTVHLTSMSGAWIHADNTTINPKLYLAGNMTLSAMSTKTYTFAEIDGPGALSFAASADSQPTAINITKVAEGYSGTISSTLENPVTIDTLERVDGAKTAGTKLLDLGDVDSANITVTTATVGGTRAPHANKVVSGDRGIYIVGGTTFSVY